MRNIIVLIALISGFKNLQAQKNLIGNGNFSEGTKWFSSQYKFIGDAGDSQGAGEYFIGPDAHKVHYQWDGKGIAGNFLIVDGASGGDNFFWQQNVVVQKNKKYTFQIALQTVSDPESYEQAKVGVYINNKLIKILSAPEIYTEWEHHQITVNAKNDLLKITLKVENPNWMGIDFGVDDLGLFEGTRVKKIINKKIVQQRKLNKAQKNTVKEYGPAPQVEIAYEQSATPPPPEMMPPVNEEFPVVYNSVSTYQLYTCSEEVGNLELTNTGDNPIDVVIFRKNEKATFFNQTLQPQQKTVVAYQVTKSNNTLYFTNYDFKDCAIKVKNCNNETTLKFTPQISTAKLNLIF
jgi:hypothetical protein